MSQELDQFERLIGKDQDFYKRLEYYPESTPSVLGAVRFGVVFVMAWWSGPSRMAWAELKRAIRRLDTQERLEIVVLDIDGMTGFEATTLGPTVAGAGELTWVRDGRPACPRWVFLSDAQRVNTRLFLEGRELFVPRYGMWNGGPDQPQ